MSDEWNAVKREARWSTRLLLLPLVVMWALQIFNFLTGGSLVRFGVHPRTAVGLTGILFAPLLHGGFLHLISNTVPWLIAGGLIVTSDIGEYVVVVAATWLASGLGAWAFGAAESVHVGASGVVFGFFGYLLIRGWLRRSIAGIAISIALASTYGLVMLLSALPTQAGISWQSHAFGLIGGVLAAIGLARADRRKLAAGIKAPASAVGGQRGARAPR